MSVEKSYTVITPSPLFELEKRFKYLAYKKVVYIHFGTNCNIFSTLLRLWKFSVITLLYQYSALPILPKTEAYIIK